MDEKTSKSDFTSETILDSDFHKGNSTFAFPNGDSYEGDYIAHRSGVIWREGIGTYTTKDGQIYHGKWLDDKLVEDETLEIQYPDGAQYYGNLIKNKYAGPGMYVLESNVNLLCDFSENKPTGDILLVDLKGKDWHGVANENDALLLPEHVYFNAISKECGKGRNRISPIKEPKLKPKPMEKSETHLEDDNNKDLEIKIFAKTKKTISDLQFENSEWYRNYTNFRKVHDDIMNKVKNENENVLDEKEKEWYKKYKGFKEKYLAILESRTVTEKNMDDYKLFELYNSVEYKNSCPPISVFYPTENQNGDDEVLANG